MYEPKTHEEAKEPKFLCPELLLHPNIPKPLHGVNPRTILGDAWWDEQRQIAYAKNNYCCWACGIHKSKAEYHQWLEAHEFYKIDYEKGEMKLIEIVALCHSCHNYIHSGRMEMLVRNGNMSKEKQLNVLNHGDRILLEARLKRKKLLAPIAQWKEWHLILNGKCYYSKFKDINEWAEFYQKDKS